MLTLSEHFIDQWRRYFAEDPPPISQIVQIINRSIWLQRCKMLYEEDGTPHKQLGTYWDPKRALVLKVDWQTKKVVTVITAKTQPHNRRRPV